MQIFPLFLFFIPFRFSALLRYDSGVKRSLIRFETPSTCIRNSSPSLLSHATVSPSSLHRTHTDKTNTDVSAPDVRSVRALTYTSRYSSSLMTRTVLLFRLNKFLLLHLISIPLQLLDLTIQVKLRLT